MTEFLPLPANDNSERRWIVYTLADSRSPSEVRYVGITSATTSRRVVQHKSDKNRNHRTNWIASVVGGGGDIIATTVADGLSELAAKAMEVALIASHRSAGSRLVNSTDGGDGNVGWNPTAETRSRMSASASAAMTPEHKLRLSAIQRELVTPEVRARIGTIRRGMSMPKSARTRISSAMQEIARMRPPRSGGYKGVYQKGSKWQAVITVGGTRNHLGTFAEKDAAATAYNRAAYIAWGKNCFLNMPPAANDNIIALEAIE